MNKRRKFIALLGILICVALLMSCKKNDTGEETYELYYVNVQTQALEQEKVQIEGDTTEEKIESMLKELKKNPEDVEEYISQKDKSGKMGTYKWTTGDIF